MSDDKTKQILRSLIERGGEAKGALSHDEAEELSRAIVEAAYPRNGSFYGLVYGALCGSLDAAMSLVPEGWSFGLWREIGKRDTCRMWRGGHDNVVGAATPALALVLACLRARLSEEETHG